MELLFICRDALENSLTGNIVMAMEAKKAGAEVAVLFTQEALAALGGQSFNWSPLFQDRETRMRISGNAKKMGIPLASPRDSRWTEPRQLLPAAKAAGVELLACPTWTALLELQGKLPPEVREIDLPSVLQAIREAKTVIGSL